MSLCRLCAPTCRLLIKLVQLWMVHPEFITPGEEGSAKKNPRVEYLSTLSKHAAPVNVVRFSPNGMQRSLVLLLGLTDSFQASLLLLLATVRLLKNMKPSISNATWFRWLHYPLDTDGSFAKQLARRGCAVCQGTLACPQIHRVSTAPL